MDLRVERTIDAAIRRVVGLGAAGPLGMLVDVGADGPERREIFLGAPLGCEARDHSLDGSEEPEEVRDVVAVSAACSGRTSACRGACASPPAKP